MNEIYIYICCFEGGQFKEGTFFHIPPKTKIKLQETNNKAPSFPRGLIYYNDELMKKNPIKSGYIFVFATTFIHQAKS